MERRNVPGVLHLVTVLLLTAGGDGCATASADRPTRLVQDSSMEPPGTIVFALSAAPRQTLANGAIRDTGFFLGEFYESYRALVAEGYTVVVATPDGLPAVVDPESLDPKYWAENPELLAEAKEFVAADSRLAKPMPLADVATHMDEFQGIVVPGGQGVMIDLIEDEDLHAVVFELGRTGRAVGLVCHAPALLTKFPPDASPFRGRRVTSVSGLEEFYIERFVMKGKATNRRIGHQLRALGYVHRAAAPGRGFAVQDCNLATSQNPFSGKDFNAAFRSALAVARSGGRCD